MARIKRYFLTGLLIILPLFVTIYFLLIIFNFIDSLCGGFINYYFKKHLGFVIPGLGFILGISTVTLLGFLATHFLGKKIFLKLEQRIIRLPFIRQIYPAAKQIIGFLFSQDRPAFKSVVLVEYPSKGIWSIGFVTNDSFSQAQEKTGKELLHIFIATTPSPLSGFLVLVPKDEVKFLDISIDDGLKLIISGGILKPS